MPHVIIGDPPDLRQYFESYVPWLERRPDGAVLQTQGAYLRQDGATLLVEALAIEVGPPMHFFITVEAKKQQVTVRCFPHPSPPRTEGVKRLVAAVAQQVLARGGRVERTNLDGLIADTPRS
ncbi:MAG: hypothetical protein AB7O52_10015 [Planctomycetota bacterium]